ncbi:hypothetical protein HanIR_Chr14g0683641 [Helianthus annuus]|nr:hypothetical protein HanIR_Chr14g0683641 [Helianthus annuus]
MVPSTSIEFTKPDTFWVPTFDIFGTDPVRYQFLPSNTSTVPYQVYLVPVSVPIFWDFRYRLVPSSSLTSPLSKESFMLLHNCLKCHFKAIGTHMCGSHLGFKSRA